MKKSLSKLPSTSPERKRWDGLKQLKKSLSWQYNFEDLTLLPAKLSVTQLTHHSDEYTKIDYSKALQRKPKIFSGQAEPAQPQTIGSASHLIISKIDLTKPVDTAAIKKVMEKLNDDNR